MSDVQVADIVIPAVVETTGRIAPRLQAFINMLAKRNIGGAILVEDPSLGKARKLVLQTLASEVARQGIYAAKEFKAKASFARKYENGVRVQLEPVEIGDVESLGDSVGDELFDEDEINDGDNIGGADDNGGLSQESLVRAALSPEDVERLEDPLILAASSSRAALHHHVRVPLGRDDQPDGDLGNMFNTPPDLLLPQEPPVLAERRQSYAAARPTRRWGLHG